MLTLRISIATQDKSRVHRECRLTQKYSDRPPNQTIVRLIFQTSERRKWRLIYGCLVFKGKHYDAGYENSRDNPGHRDCDCVGSGTT